MLVEDVKCIAAQLELHALSDLHRFLQPDVEVAITRLPEVLNARSFASVEVKATCWFKRTYIQHRLSWVEVRWRLQERRCASEQCGRAEVVQLGRHIAE